jgi:hypothetical protein
MLVCFHCKGYIYQVLIILGTGVNILWGRRRGQKGNAKWEKIRTKKGNWMSVFKDEKGKMNNMRFPREGIGESAEHGGRGGVGFVEWRKGLGAAIDLAWIRSSRPSKGFLPFLTFLLYIKEHLNKLYQLKL